MTLPSALGTTAAITENKRKEAKDKEEQSPHIKYILKQWKKDLVSMCKNKTVYILLVTGNTIPRKGEQANQ